MQTPTRNFRAQKRGDLVVEEIKRWIAERRSYGKRWVYHAHRRSR
jgi:hypothetical protein